jgi:type IV fimbrial biogenesis protein FimT
MTPRPTAPTRPRERGFTLIELLTVVLIVAVVTAAAAPTVSEMAAERRHDAVTAHITGAMRLARSEAMKRSAMVLIEPQDAASSWGGALNIYVDADGNPQNGFNIGDTLIRSSMKTSSVITVSGPARLAIDPLGRNRALQAQPELTQSSIVLCSGGKTRTLTIDRSGFASVTGTPTTC